MVFLTEEARARLLCEELGADLTKEQQWSRAASNALVAIGKWSNKAKALKRELRVPSLSREEQRDAVRKIEYCEQRAQYEQDCFNQLIGLLKNAKAHNSVDSISKAEAATGQPSLTDAATEPKPEFPNCARWLAEQMRLRKIDTPHRLQELSADSEGGCVHHKTIQRVLDGLPVRQFVLTKIIRGLNQAGTPLGIPPLTITDIPDW